MRFFLLTSLFLFFLIYNLFPQPKNIKFSHISIDEGLSQNSINCIYQDSKGFMWFGTMDGLNKYDGYNFKIYRHEPGNANTLSDYAVNAIAEDKSGILWIATREGLNRFDPQTETIKIYKNVPGTKNTLSNSFITSLFADKSDNLWIGTRGGLDKLELKTDKIFNYKNDPSNLNSLPAGQASLSSNIINTIYQSSDGSLWVGTQNGLNKFDYKSGGFISYKNNPEDDNSISSSRVITITEDSNLRLWIGTFAGLNLFQNGKFIRFLNSKDQNSLSNNHIRSVSVDKFNNLWIATIGGGLNKFYPETGKFIRFNNNKNNPNTISSNFLKFSFIDNAGILWIGTHEKGLNKFSFGSQKFIHINHNVTDGTGISDNNVLSIFEDSNENLWVGTEGGLDKISTASLLQGKFSFDHFKSEPNNSNSLSYNSVTSIIEDEQGNLWIGTFGIGLNRYSKSKNEFTHFIHQPDNPNSLSHNFIHTLYEDKKGIIWIGTGLGGLVRYDPYKNYFKAYKPNPEDPENSISSVEVTSIAEDKEGFLWIGTTTGGLNKFDKEKEVFYHYKPDPGNKNSLNSMRINTLYLDDENNLWIGTFGGGLNKLRIKDNFFVHYTDKNGLPGNTIFGIVEDKNGYLWLSSTKGISMFNPGKNVFKNYDINDGLQENEFVQNSCFVNKKTGYIYFGGINGFNIFHPDSIKEDNFIPPVVITDFKIFNQSVSIGSYGNELPLQRHISFSDEITLSHSDNVISFDFASLHFANPEKNQYAYKMEGFDKDWIYAGNVQSASYTNLDPGAYIFKVKGTNSDGIWNEKRTSIIININPPWWRTWWAYLIYGLVFLSAILALRKYEMNRLRLKNNLERKEFETQNFLEIDQMKSRFFANISHEFRTPLTLILGILDRYLNKEGSSYDFKIMKKNAQRLLQLINQLLELSKLESGNVKIQARKTDLYQFIRRIASSFLSLAEQKEIDFKFNNLPLSSVSETGEIFAYIDRDKMETVIYNLLSNALKFTPKGEKVYIDLSSSALKAEIRITNTGVSISEDDLPHIFDRFYQGDDSETRGFEGTGIGLALAKELVELHYGEVEANSVQNKETAFKIILLLGNAHFSPEQVVEIEEKETEITFDEKKFDLIDEVEISGDENKKPLGDSNIVLVVEDHFDLRTFICEQLVRKDSFGEGDYSVIEAEDGEKGLKLAEEIIPDLVISDIMMPNMDGYQLCKELKTNINTNHIPVILLTAKASLDNKLEGLETGADDYLIKPFNTNELRTRVKNLIRVRQQMREKFRSEMILKPAEVIVPSNQKAFIEKLTNIIEKHIEDENFSVEALSKEIGMSRSQLHRKLKALTNQSPSEFIRVFRLQRAADLITQKAGNMAEISYKVGFSSQAYFTKLFQEMYGVTPSEFKKRSDKSEN